MTTAAGTTAGTTAGELLSRTAAALRRAGIDGHRFEARLLLAHALGVEPLAVVARPERRLTAAEARRVEGLTARRANREPMAHITGRREFWGLDFIVTRDTLDPRPDSETVVAALLDALPDRRRPLRVLDLGTGTGCLLLALLSELLRAVGVGVDASDAACRVARANADALGLSPRVEVRSGDWGRGLDGLFDVIVSNPPYIPSDAVDTLAPEVAVHEPRRALDGGPDGLDAYRMLAPDIDRLLAPGGVAGVEVGIGQAPLVSRIFADRGMPAARVCRDLAGTERCIVIRRGSDRVLQKDVGMSAGPG